MEMKFLSSNLMDLFEFIYDNKTKNNLSTKSGIYIPSFQKFHIACQQGMRIAGGRVENEDNF